MVAGRIEKAQRAQTETRQCIRLTLIVEFDPDTYDLEDTKAIVLKAQQTGDVKTARLENLPSTMDLKEFMG